MQFDEFRRGLAPGALRRHHCQHGVVRKAAEPASACEVDLDARPRADRRQSCNANRQLIGSHRSAVQGCPRTLAGPERVARGIKVRALCLDGRPSAPRKRFLPPLPAPRPAPHLAPPPSIPTPPPPPPPPSRPLTLRPLPSPRERPSPSPDPTPPALHIAVSGCRTRAMWCGGWGCSWGGCGGGGT